MQIRVEVLLEFVTRDRQNVQRNSYLFVMHRYEYIETDLLGSLQMEAHRIALYRSKGVEKASS